MHANVIAHNPCDAALAESLVKLWPHRMHESNWFMNLLCYFGLHHWVPLEVAHLLAEKKEVRFCRWCPKLRVDGMIYPAYSGFTDTVIEKWGESF